MKTTSIIAIEGVGEVYSQKMKENGLKTISALLEKGKTEKGREKIAKDTGINRKLILEWVNHADLFRIDGVGSQYSELLEASGVDTVPELALRKFDHLFTKLGEVNAEKKLVRKLPALKQVEDWVEQAKKLPQVVTY
jgi:predicted flap endonuclease-1-like 5' DNA nuclease